jgi:fucose permease
MLFTTALLSGGLYDPREEAHFHKLHCKSIEDPEQLETSPLLTPSGLTPSSSAPSPSHSLMALAAVGFVASYGEGAMVTWSMIYFERYISVPSSLHAIGFFTFMACMVLGRFACDFLRKTFGRRKLIRVSGFLSGLGVCLLVAAPSLSEGILQILLSEVGVGLTGLGLSTIIPTVFSSAGHLPGAGTGTTPAAGTAIATVAAFTYCGSIVAPPMIGAISQSLDSLR